MKCTILRFFSVVVALATIAVATEDFRLPRLAVPEHYEIKILTDLSNDFTYRGQVRIYFGVTEETDKIVLHSKNLFVYENETKLEETAKSSDSFDSDENFLSKFKWHSSRKKKESDDFSNDFSGESNTKESEAAKNSEHAEKFEPGKNGTAEHENIFSHAEYDSITFRLSSGKSDEETTSTTEFSGNGEDANDVGPMATPETPEQLPVTFTSVLPGVDTVTTPEPDVDEITFYGPTVAGVDQNVAGDTSETVPDEDYPKPESHVYQSKNNFLTIDFDKSLVPGKKYKLELNYYGVLADSLIGFHRVAYSKKNSQKPTWLASTVFEPNEARTAFPCFDEPHLKATFDVILGHEKKYAALSNMPLEATSPIEGKPEWQWSKFQRTPRMSTYLVAFLISDLEHLTTRQNQIDEDRNVTYRFWARHDVLYKTRYAMRIVPLMKNYLENLFQVPEVLPKHDFIALPSFVSTALENWGLYSFAEKNLLFTSGFSSIFNKYQITQVLGHEVSHMWFGNMVTPKWWDQIWLSEGFSNFFEILAADHVQPSWDLKTTSVIFPYLKVFSLDALQSSHPLVPEFDDPNDLNEIFDSISYQKGFYLVRMLNYTLGEESFMKGVRKYLKSNLLSNVDEDDLWESLNEFAHKDGVLPPEHHLKEIMRNWTRKTGYPILQVTRDYENNTATVTQKRFLRFKGDYEFRDNFHGPEEEDDETKWWIPLTYTTGSEIDFRNSKPKTWMNPKESSTTLTDMPSKNDFLLMNLDASGLYRVNYDERNWALIVSYLINENFSEISLMNRVQILDDLLDFARTGLISYEKALEATGYLKREKHFLPWKAAFSNFDYISRMFRSRDGSRIFKKFMRNLVTPRFEELGFEVGQNESFSDSLNRKQIVKWACKTGLRQCTRKSTALFKRWMESKRPDEYNPIPSNLRSVVYCTAVEHGGNKEWQFLWQRYLNNVLTDKTAILYGLGCTKSTRTLRKYLDWSVNDSSGIRKQDTPIVFKSVTRNDAGFNLAKNFLKEKFITLRKYLGNNPYFLPQIIDTLASKMNHPKDLMDLEIIEQESYSSYRSAPKSFRQAFERIKFNIDWTEKNYEIITDWLKRQKN